MPPLQRIVVLYLVGIFPGDHLTSSFPLQRRDLSSVTELQLNMAPNSFDDQYKGCEDAMAAELEELNRTEFANNRVYAEAWQKAERKISLSPPAGLKREYALALAAYTIEGPLYRDFNAADEVLIPPYEKFEVAGPQKPGTTTIDLLTLGESSTYNCAFVKGGSASHLSPNLEAPFLLWGFLLFAGGLGSPGLL